MTPHATPGPLLYEPGIVDTVRDSTGYVRITISRQCDRETNPSGWLSDEQAAEWGRLIAAAPALLAFVERVRDGMADDRAYREAARAVLRDLSHASAPKGADRA